MHYFLLPNSTRTFNIKSSSLDHSKLKDIVDKSSEVNRNLGLFFVVFLFYLIITTAGISDLQLLLLDKGIILPFVFIALPIESFVWITPIIILGLHLNLLINLMIHSVKLSIWLENEKKTLLSKKKTDQTQIQLHPFLFNHILEEESAGFLRITKLLVYCSCFFLPMGTLFYIEYRFADLHDVAKSNWHFTAFFIDALMVLFFYPSITATQYSQYGNKTFLQRFISRGLIPLRVIFYLMTSIKERNFNRFREGLSATRFINQFLFAFLTFMAILYLIIIHLISSDTRYKAIIAFAKGEDWNIVYKLALSNDSSFLAEYNQSFNDYRDSIKRNYIPLPIIKVRNEKIVNYSPSTQEVLLAKQSNLNLDSLIMEYTKGVILDNRNLTFVDLSGCVIINGQFNNTKLIHASFEKTLIPNGSFKKSNLKEANFILANLNGSNLESADLQNTNLLFTQLIGAELAGSNLQNADIHNTQLQGADLTFANLEGIKINSSDLTGSRLSYANLKCTQFHDVDLRGTNIYSSNLEAFSSLYSKIHGQPEYKFEFHTSESSLYITHQRLKEFEKDSLQILDLIKYQLKGALFYNCKVSGLNIREESLKGSYFIFSDFTSIPSDEEIKSIALFIPNKKSVLDFKEQMSNSRLIPNIKEYENSEEGFIKARLDLVNNSQVKMRSLLLESFDKNKSGIELRANKAILDYCKKNNLSNRLVEISTLKKEDYPGLSDY